MGSRISKLELLLLVTGLLTTGVPGESMAAAEPRIYIALDTSGSMKNHLSWLPRTILNVEKTLELNGEQGFVTFSLIGFTDSSVALASGNALAITDAIRRLRLEGGTEDGFIPLLRIADETVDSGARVLLVTDEDRDPSIPTEMQEVINTLLSKGIAVHAALPFSLDCGGNEMVALEYPGVGYDHDFARHDCGTHHVERLGRFEYANIAFATGGTVWFMTKLKGLEQDVGESIAFEFLSRFGRVFFADVRQSGDKSVGSAITFDAGSTVHSLDGHSVTAWAWDFDADGLDDVYGPVVAHIYQSGGEKIVRLTLRDDQQPAVTQHQTVRVVVK